MTGTEKQIKWATDILETIKNCINDYENNEKVKNDPRIEQVKELNKNIVENIENAYAGEVIDTFKDVENFKDLYNRIAVVAKVGNSYGKKDWRYKF